MVRKRERPPDKWLKSCQEYAILVGADEYIDDTQESCLKEWEEYKSLTRTKIRNRNLPYGKEQAIL